ncbi:uncharacterized protein YukE [Nocardioides cavernae]|uniref:Uncharacterized protein YukE n=1 Tax=Nocardioides cavernae TaxID=1921566 RepID=A0A7Y9H0A8_9ACTN|nr:WXG100 family type VII secretion target [Nocardioides cavernae]NYE35616.1 uncharacterized protein YukE [Nocardioides cavernae]
MIVSGTLHIDPAEHAAATASLAARLDDLAARRRAAEATVEGLLRTWHGEAAAAFRDEWEVWSAAAASVVSDLDAAVSALPGARADVVRADGAAGTTTADLAGRLG